jgi:hypothetical protein
MEKSSSGWKRSQMSNITEVESEHPRCEGYDWR